jgi:hypothetical protein
MANSRYGQQPQQSRATQQPCACSMRPHILEVQLLPAHPATCGPTAAPSFAVLWPLLPLPQVEIRACTSPQEPIIVDINNVAQMIYVSGRMAWQGSIKFINSAMLARRGNLFQLLSVLSVVGNGVVVFKVCAVWRPMQWPVGSVTWVRSQVAAAAGCVRPLRWTAKVSLVLSRCHVGSEQLLKLVVGIEQMVWGSQLHEPACLQAAQRDVLCCAVLCCALHLSFPQGLQIHGQEPSPLFRPDDPFWHLYDNVSVAPASKQYTLIDSHTMWIHNWMFNKTAWVLRTRVGGGGVRVCAGVWEGAC